MTRRSAGLRVLGDLLLTAGVVLGLFAGYEVFYTGIYTQGVQSQLRREVAREWAGPAASGRARLVGEPKLALGGAVAVLRVPRLGKAYAQVVVEGISTSDLRRGPGHYPGTALPGRVGNFVVSGHRTTYGAPFGHLDRLRATDPIVLETRDGWYVYRLVRQQVVAPTATDVTAPVPQRPGVRPSRAMLTFTTCHPRYSARLRLVIFGELDSSRPRAAGWPAVLAG